MNQLVADFNMDLNRRDVAGNAAVTDGAIKAAKTYLHAEKVVEYSRAAFRKAIDTITADQLVQFATPSAANNQAIHDIFAGGAWHKLPLALFASAETQALFGSLAQRLTDFICESLAVAIVNPFSLPAGSALTVAPGRRKVNRGNIARRVYSISRQFLASLKPDNFQSLLAAVTGTTQPHKYLWQVYLPRPTNQFDVLWLWLQASSEKYLRTCNYFQAPFSHLF